MVSLKTWFYRDGRPNRVARILDRGTAAIYARGVSPDYLVTLEVRGRRSCKTLRVPLVMVVVEGERYLVSMLGQKTNWVHNVRASGCEATLRHGRCEEVFLEEIGTDRRAPVLKEYLHRAPNARAHVPISLDAPLADFEQLASRYPVFRVVSRSEESQAA